MVIFCPMKIKPTGGSSSFALKLQAGLSPKGHKVIFSFQKDFDLLLVNASCPLRFLIYAKITGRPIVHRLDGVYYKASVAGKKYLLYNLPIKIILHFFANFVVYQSEYSKKCCDKFLNVNRFIPKRIIYNGVDTSKFSNRGQTVSLRDFSDQQIFISASRFRRHDQITPLITAFKIYLEKHDRKAKLVIIGNFEGEVINLAQKYKDNKNFSFIGPVPNEKLSAYLRAADIFLFTHLNPPCPNNIIEAMSCGLPICGVADGAMPELTTAGKNSELIPVTTDGFSSPRSLDLDLFADNMSKIYNNAESYSAQSRLKASEKFSNRQMVNSYLDVFNEIRDKNRLLKK
jgi:glycosyltransferase involved in cell wall biosynthesis